MTMYIYNIEVIVQWSYHDSAEDAIQNGDASSYRVSGENFNEAYKKVLKFATDKKLIWKDEDGDGVTRTHRPIAVVDVVSVQKEQDELDG